MRFKLVIELDEDYLQRVRKFRVYQRLKEIIKQEVNISLFDKGKVVSIMKEENNELGKKFLGKKKTNQNS